MPASPTPDHTAAELRQLHAALLDCWNRRDARGFAARFAPDGNVVGFDGSAIDGARAIEAHLPPTQTRVNPAVNAVQSLVAHHAGAGWRIQLFQNTPAAFHGRPEAAAALTAELQQQLGAGA